MQVGTLSVEKLFGREVHYQVPLYQRPYVWNEAEQWRLLWDDLRPLAERVANKETGRAHFLGASVQEAIAVPSGATEIRLIIDGQQRMTTLQLVLKAFHDVAAARGIARYPDAIRRYLGNDDPLIDDPKKRLKLWPTRSDQEDYQAVMDTASPACLREAIGSAGRKFPIKGRSIVNAYAFFYMEIDAWLAEDEARAESLVAGLFGAVRAEVRMVVIDLDSKDDAQAVFETLNARGAPLLAADLVKNSLLSELTPDAADEAYRKYWKSFDSNAGFWRELVGRGHAQRARIETFLQHSLTLMTQKSVSAAHLYSAYREFAHERSSGTPIERLARLKRLGDIFERLQGPQADPRLDGFYYRLKVLDVVTAWPFILALYERYASNPETVRSVLLELETFLVRRVVCRLNTRGYADIFLRLTNIVTETTDDVVNAVRHELLRGKAELDRTPTDAEFQKAWTNYPLYQNLTRARTRFLLEAIEAELRSDFSEDKAVTRNLTIEHVLPQGWRENWPLPDGVEAEDRDRLLHTIGNLTLLKGKFNAFQSNRPWTDGNTPDGGKRENLREHSVLHLNKGVCDHERWAEAEIVARGSETFEIARRLWPMPTA